MKQTKSTKVNRMVKFKQKKKQPWICKCTVQSASNNVQVLATPTPRELPKHARTVARTHSNFFKIFYFIYDCFNLSKNVM